MNKKTSYTANCRMVFKAWSRKAYAVFQSLHRQVSIGHLPVEICDVAVQKINDGSVVGAGLQGVFFKVDELLDVERDEAGRISWLGTNDTSPVFSLPVQKDFPFYFDDILCSQTKARATYCGQRAFCLGINL